MGNIQFLDLLESTLSNALQVSERHYIQSSNSDQLLDEIYLRHVSQA